jgi:hypothetical protein
MGANPDLCGEKLEANRLSCGTTPSLYIIFDSQFATPRPPPNSIRHNRTKQYRGTVCIEKMVVAQLVKRIDTSVDHEGSLLLSQSNFILHSFKPLQLTPQLNAS